ncbi:MAG: UvrD-helicase domain-containing protein [Planctomycetaceae bacterium]
MVKPQEPEERPGTRTTAKSASRQAILDVPVSNERVSVADVEFGVSALENRVIFASAGTGKTFQLANRYISTLREAAPERILASTFTRKAAGEILERVLKHLALAATSEADAAKVAGFPGLEGITVTEARTLLGNLTRHLHRVRISTLDAFFINVATNLSLELGLPTGWRLMDENEETQLRLTAIERLLAENPEQVRRLLKMLHPGASSRSVQSQLAGAIVEFYSAFRQSLPEAWQRIPERPRATDDELTDAVEVLANAPLPSDKRWEKAHQKSLAQARTRQWSEFFSGGLPKCVLSGECRFYSKPVEETLQRAYETLIGLARRDLVAEFRDRTIGTFELLQMFDRHSKQVRREAKAVSFDDVVWTLVEGGEQRRLGQLAYRLDTQFDHLLLDEFQDTSLSQWRALEALARSAASEPEGSFFCVGDSKQAIYSWRGGNANLFLSIPEQLNIESSPLNESFRSSPVIMEGVNVLCERLGYHPSLDEHHLSAITSWSDRVEEHRAFHQQLPGYVSLQTAPRAEDYRQQVGTTMEFAIERIRELTQQTPGASIGVLVRKNETVQKLVHGLRAIGVPASNEGKGQLTDSVAVQAILSLLQMADHPGDTVARFHVANSPIGRHYGFEDDRQEEQGRDLATRVRLELQVLGYGRFLDRLVRAIESECSEHSKLRLQQLVDAAFAFTSRQSLRPTEFVAFVKSAKYAAPTNAAVRVMTVHQSKGLEFDIVVLPELHSPVTGGRPSVVRASRSPMEPPNVVMPYPNQHLASLLPDVLQEAVRSTIAESIQEEMCQLYVAVTRARFALHLVIPPSSATEKTLPKSLAGVLRAAVAEGKGEPNSLLWELGDADWSQGMEEFRPSTAMAGDAVDVEVMTPDDAILHDAERQEIQESWPVVRLADGGVGGKGSLPTVSPSQMGHRSRRLASLLSNVRADAMTQGSLIHAFFEQVEWMEEGVPSADDLRVVADGFEAEVDLVKRCIERFSQLLKHPDLAWVLSRRSYLPPRDVDWSRETLQSLSEGPFEVEAYRERQLRVRDGNQIIGGIMDRLVLLRRDGKVVAADILDFKTDGLESGRVDFTEERWGGYGEQLRLYARAVALQYGLELGSLSARLLVLATGQVVRVPLPAT